MILKLFTVCAVIQLAVSQLPITFQDGKIGVNFGGYHAEAGLGGLLTGNAAHGGLTASAGTPYGQTAVAGLGGNTGPNARGGLFAGATANSNVGASASLVGDTNNAGSFGVGQAEAHAGGVKNEVIKTVSTNVETDVGTNVGTNVGTAVDVAPVVVEAPVETSTLSPSPEQFVTEYEQTVVQSDIITPIPSEQSTSGYTYIPPKSEPTKPSKKPEQTEKSEESEQSENSEQTTQSIIIQSTTSLAPKTTAASPGYTPVAPVDVPAQVGTSSSSISGTAVGVDEDDNDLTDNRVPTVAQTVTQVVNPAVVHVQKIKVRPQPQYTVYQKQVQVPVVTKTYTPVQYQIPAYQPVVYQKRIQISAPYPQIAQRVETVEATPGPSTTSTTPRPPYVYTYDKQKVINEIFSIPFHALRAVNEIINAKLAGGYSVQKTISYA